MGSCVAKQQHKKNQLENEMKFYSSKANAKRAAKKAGLDIETTTLIEKDGKFAYVNEQDAEFIEEYGTCECPQCNINLDNGISSYTELMAMGAEQKKGARGMKQEFVCLACDGEFGPEIVHTKKEAPKSTGLKIEKDREEKNGVVRPSAGGSCAAVWDFCDAQSETPTVKDLKAQAEAEKWNINNTVIEYYNWRKFNGIVGRIKKSK